MRSTQLCSPKGELTESGENSPVGAPLGAHVYSWLIYLFSTLVTRHRTNTVF